MRKSFFVLAICASFLKTFADEGMWLPFLLKQLNEADMKKNGCKLSAKDIYDVNNASLKDAIVHFGGGCTAEIISDKGLLLTNHHCGYSAIATHSTVDKDYLTNGFWAMNQSEELQNAGLTATIIQRIEDVTTAVNVGVLASYNEKQVDSVQQKNIKQLTADVTKGTKYEAYIKPFFYGNQFILFVTLVYKDVRLVGAPPSFIGKFGGDTDNWVWPRHTGDFSIFRIYADKNNEPAEYSADNVPYKPKKSLSISMKGVNEGDFTMVFGFPGRTQEYLFSDAVDITMNQSDPDKVNLREKRLAIMNRFMKANDTTRIAYASNYASVANYWKKWLGEMQGLKKFDAVNKKIAFEKKFIELLGAEPAEKEKFNKIFSDFHSLYGDMKAYQKQIDYYSECLLGVNAITLARSGEKVLNNAKKMSADNSLKELNKYTVDIDKYFKNYNKAMDKSLCRAMLEMYVTGLDKNLRVPAIDSLLAANQNNYDALTDKLYNESAFTNKEKYINALKNGNMVALESDIIYKLWKSIGNYYTANVFPQYTTIDMKLTALYKQYVNKLTKVYKDKKFYPDANSTLRVAYGKVKGYKARDAVKFDYFTTLDGMMEKEDPNNDDFIIFPKLKEIYKKKDYGQFADKDGTVHVSFIASNHTTGGNSGSPVLNANGELIGTNYDRVWEGTMSDIMFNPEICRNITLDVRYTLFVVDKYAGAGYLLNEMKLVK
ncbi:MAG: S46 family peptidase [Bacteroidia bacterium]